MCYIVESRRLLSCIRRQTASELPVIICVQYAKPGVNVACSRSICVTKQPAASVKLAEGVATDDYGNSSKTRSIEVDEQRTPMVMYGRASRFSIPPP